MLKFLKDLDKIREAIEKAQVVDRPSLIIGTTIMAKGAANVEGDHETHGAPLDYDEISATKDKLGLPQDSFYSNETVSNHFRKRFLSLSEQAKEWKSKINKALKNDDFKKFWDSIFDKDFSDLKFPYFESNASIATRKAFGMTLDIFANQIPNLIGGSADLEPSNYTGNFAKKHQDFSKENRKGRNLAFGVREFPMAAAMNGIALHGGLIPFGGTFLVFADYERPALRLAAIQKCRVLHEFTHDSFWVGEDGPTHQPVEQAMSLRSIPDFNVFRPADAKETAACFKLALECYETPSALLLSRQGVPVLDLEMGEIIKGVSKGAYTVKDEPNPELIFLATGSETSLALEVAKKMHDKRIKVVSMPCWEIFEHQSQDYKNTLIPQRGALKVSFEAGVTLGWERYNGINGLSIGIDHFGASAPGKDLAKEFGFTVDSIEVKIRKFLGALL